ncbi:flagellar hook capping FlgD N-terminal domain-containing protein [Phaeovulum sp. NW3]|uniref:flagellar hook capping FlgD N-terminal domain-containing protein n=1 Tax=Phaeovulum sp. NW3 TaxID=2934933 RepID=UPI0024C30EA3|nr:flagellar hook capping FlgD N-terminal domain-containing protein [Phaeovulum sp. NW3]MCL7465254.1 flagellar hook assembly protein FlgD [Phaeovulum sp. NW3]
MVTAISSASMPTSAQTTQEKPAGGMISSDFQTFLLMLTTQMQNQDPLNPIESSDYAVQLATFSGVEQQVRTNQLLEGLAAQMGVAGISQLAGWVGLEARAAAPVAFDGAPLTLAPNPAAGADQALLIVKDASGNTVARDPLAVSDMPIQWDGSRLNGSRLPAGLYSFEIESYNSGVLLSSNPVEAYAEILEARGTPEGTVLVLRGGATIAATDVTALRQPQ